MLVPLQNAKTRERAADSAASRIGKFRLAPGSGLYNNINLIVERSHTLCSEKIYDMIAPILTIVWNLVLEINAGQSAPMINEVSYLPNAAS